MQFFLDSANLEEIKSAWEMGIISGVTTNPSLVAKENERDLPSLLTEITRIVDGPISAEVIALDYPGMVREAQELASIHSNIVIKIPQSVDGLKAVKTLAGQGIKTNMTLIFTPIQALLAARAGATYVSPFLGRLDDIGEIGLNLLNDICEIFTVHNLQCAITAAAKTPSGAPPIPITISIPLPSIAQATAGATSPSVIKRIRAPHSLICLISS
jgi:transaldolase